jgi:hypothetical protein
MTRRVGEVRDRPWRWLAWVLIPLGLLLVVGANAHLVYVAVQSQPGCVEHVKAAGEGKGYRAARSAC